MLRNLFGRAPASDSPARRLEHVSQLEPGDMISLGPDPRPELSGQSLRVRTVLGYDFRAGSGDERTLFEMENPQTDAGRRLLLWESVGPDLEPLSFAWPASHQELRDLLDMDALADLLSGSQSDGPARVPASGPGAAAHPWVAADYVEEIAREIIRIDGDPRKLDLDPHDLSDQEHPVDFYRLAASDQSGALEVIVHDGGQTDVWFVACLPAHRIEEWLPGS